MRLTTQEIEEYWLEQMAKLSPSHLWKEGLFAFMLFLSAYLILRLSEHDRVTSNLFLVATGALGFYLIVTGVVWEDWSTMWGEEAASRQRFVVLVFSSHLSLLILYIAVWSVVMSIPMAARYCPSLMWLYALIVIVVYVVAAVLLLVWGPHFARSRLYRFLSGYYPEKMGVIGPVTMAIFVITTHVMHALPAGMGGHLLSSAGLLMYLSGVLISLTGFYQCFILARAGIADAIEARRSGDASSEG